MRYIVVLIAVFGFWCELEAQNLGLLRRPRNGAISAPMGQGLDLVHSAEPLGKGRFRLRIQNRSNPISVPGLGAGSIYTGGYGLGYGIGDALELSFLVPFLLDSVGGLNKYGSGDPVLGVKFSRPGKLPANFYTGYQLLLGLPFGYKGKHALDAIGGIRSFSSESFDIGLQGLMDIHFDFVSLYLNGGFFRSANIDVLSQLIYGIGMELGRRSRWASINLEYQSQVTFSEQARAVGVFKVGTRLGLFKGVELELNKEFGFIDYPIISSFSFGVRLHGFMSGRRRLAWRHEVYETREIPKRDYQPSQALRLAIVDFEGFEEYAAGQRIVEKIKNRLEPHDSLEVVDIQRYADVPNRGFLKPRQALELATKLGVDVVVTGAVSNYDFDRFAGVNLPYMVKLPEAEVEVGLRFRVLEFDPTRTQVQVYNEDVAGAGKIRKGVRLFSGDRRDITARASAVEIQGVHEAALDDLVDNMLAVMADQLSWVPPDFLP